MPTYRYVAKDKAGKTVTGTLTADDEKAVVDSLKKQTLTATSVKEEKAKINTVVSTLALKLGGSKIKLSELVLFSRQLATMIDAGIPLLQALDILGDQVEKKDFKEIILDVRKNVSSGSSFYKALARHPRAFSSLFVNMVKAGESSGALDDIMERLASYLEKTDSLIRKVRSALVYPSVVSAMAVIITLVMMLNVVPVFKQIFIDFGGKLPLPTQILIGVSDFLIHYIVLWMGVVAVVTVAVIRYLKTEKGADVFDAFKLNVPIFGIIFRKVAVSKFSRTLSTLVKSGVPILSALEIVGKTAGNRMIEQAVEKVRVSIREGENISDPLMRSKVFPSLVVRMIAVGEQTGELEKMLTKIADFYDDQVDAAVSGLTSLIEPLVIAFLGIVIGGIVICMFLPIFQLSALVSGG